MDWKQRFLQWLTYRPDADMLKSIRESPYQMKFLADSTGIIRLQTKEDLTSTDLQQHQADHQAAWFITLGLPNSIYMKVDFLASAQQMWNYLEDMHRAEELEHMRMQQILESCLSKNFPKTILPAPPSPVVTHASYLQTLLDVVGDQ